MYRELFLLILILPGFFFCRSAPHRDLLSDKRALVRFEAESTLADFEDRDMIDWLSSSRETARLLNRVQMPAEKQLSLWNTEAAALFPLQKKTYSSVPVPGYCGMRIRLRHRLIPIDVTTGNFHASLRTWYQIIFLDGSSGELLRTSGADDFREWESVTSVLEEEIPLRRDDALTAMEPMLKENLRRIALRAATQD